MTATMYSAEAERQVLQLVCDDCNAPEWSCPHDRADVMARHTMRVHHRRPTEHELTTVDMVAHLRVERLVRSWPEQLDQVLGGGGQLHIDSAGRRWCMILHGFGITRHRVDPFDIPRWCVAYLQPELRPIAVLRDPATVDALERWDMANPSPDHTRPHGVARPQVSAFIRTKAGL